MNNHQLKKEEYLDKTSDRREKSGHGRSLSKRKQFGGYG